MDGLDLVCYQNKIRHEVRRGHVGGDIGGIRGERWGIEMIGVNYIYM